MATATAKRNTAALTRRPPSVPKKRYEALLAAKNAASKRAREAGKERIGTLVGVGTGFAVGKLEQRGTKLPTVGGVEPTALYGTALAFGPAMFGIKGRAAQIAAEVGAAALGIAAYKFGLGQPMIAGDDVGADDDF